VLQTNSVFVNTGFGHGLELPEVMLVCTTTCRASFTYCPRHFSTPRGRSIKQFDTLYETRLPYPNV